MKRIAVLSTIYLNKPSTNGICAINLVNELKGMGHEIEVVCYEDATCSSCDIHIHTIKKKQEKINSFTRKLYILFCILIGTVRFSIDNTLVENYTRELCLMHKKKSFDAVIAMFFSPESLQAVYEFKKLFPKVKVFAYELDSIGDGISDTKHFFLIDRIYKKWLKKIYSAIDNIFIMKSHEMYWRKTFGGQFEKKLKVVDLPVLISKQMPIFASSTQISMLYAGLIEKKYRSPSYLLLVLAELREMVPFRFTFYSKGDCEEEIARAAGHTEGISQKGYVSPEELEQAIFSTDFLVSIGNSVSRSLPSKVITYLSYGKPIIHFSSQKNDVCKEYLEKYPLAYVICDSVPIKEACEKFYDFILESRGKTMASGEIQKLFYHNTPAYSAQVISSLLQ